MNTTPPLPHRARSSGFTLVEVMIVVAIIGFLAAVAYPAYLQQVAQSRRSDAKTALLDLASREETFFSTNNTYTNTAASLGYASAFPVQVMNSGAAYYQINVTTATATAFTLSAVPIGNQANDTCGTYTLDQLGTQSNTSNTTAASSCW